MPDSFNFASPPFDQLRPHQRETFKQALSVGYYAPGKPCWRPARRSPGCSSCSRAWSRSAATTGGYSPNTPRTTCSTSAGCSPAAASTATWRSRKASSTSCRPVASTSCAGEPGVRPLLPADLAAKRQLAQRDGQNLAEFIHPHRPRALAAGAGGGGLAVPRRRRAPAIEPRRRCPAGAAGEGRVRTRHRHPHRPHERALPRRAQRAGGDRAVGPWSAGQRRTGRFPVRRDDHRRASVSSGSRSPRTAR